MRRQRGFTLLEILIAIVIIVVLVGLLYMGLRAVGASSRGKATRVDLENLRLQLAELDTATKLSTAPSAWVWRGLTTQVSAASGMVDFWRVPARLDNNPANSFYDSAEFPEPLDAPGDVSLTAFDARSLVGSPQPIDRAAHPAILNTQVAIASFRAMPSNRTALGKLSPDRLMILPFARGEIRFAGADGVLYTADDVNDDAFYPVGVVVQHPDPTTGVVRYFRSILAHASSLVAGTPESDAANWSEVTGAAASNVAAPVLLDAWNNPIIFVPASGLQGVTLDTPALDWVTASNYGIGTRVRSGGIDYTCIEAHASTGTNQPPSARYWVPGGVKSRDGRPFFASAGADGDFSKGDDNVYSFEN